MARRKNTRFPRTGIEGAYVDKDGNIDTASFHAEILGDDNTVLLSPDRLDKLAPQKIERYFRVPIAKQKVGWHIVSMGDNLAKEIEATLKELVGPGMQDKLTDLVAAAERCGELHDSHSADALIANISRSACRHDICHAAQEISRYATEDFLFTSSQRKSATQARDLLLAATNALDDSRFAGAAARVKEARKAFSEIWEGNAERQAEGR